MSKARIIKGIWRRRVTWEKDGVWRTDMFKSVLADTNLEVAEFHLKSGPIVRISKEELRRVLVGGPDHYGGQIWGPFNIDPQAQTVARQRVAMKIYAQQSLPPAHPLTGGWAGEARRTRHYRYSFEK